MYEFSGGNTLLHVIVLTIKENKNCILRNFSSHCNFKNFSKIFETPDLRRARQTNALVLQQCCCLCLRRSRQETGKVVQRCINASYTLSFQTGMGLPLKLYYSQRTSIIILRTSFQYWERGAIAVDLFFVQKLSKITY